MSNEEAVVQSLMTLDLLEHLDRERESRRPQFSKLPPPPRLPNFTRHALAPPPLPSGRTYRVSSPPSEERRIVTTKDVRFKLADAWVIASEAREAIVDWKKRAQVEVGFAAMDVKLRTAMNLLDEVISELEPPTDRQSKRPTRAP